MPIKPKTLDAITIRVTRVRHRNHMSECWLYRARVEEIRLTAGNGLSADDARDLPYQYSDTSLVNARRILKAVAPNATIIESWKVTA